MPEFRELRSIAAAAMIASSLLAILAGCRESPTRNLVDAGVHVRAEWPAPQDDRVPAVGSPFTLDIATWNIEFFPLQPHTAALVADLVASLDLDLIAVQEIASVEAFEELAARLPEHDAILSEHVYSDGTFQKLGFLYRTGQLVPTASELLFTSDTKAFPRPPLQVHFTVTSAGCAPLTIAAIAVHLKAGRSHADAGRRQRAMERLEAHVNDLIDGPGEDRVVLLGDFNEVVDTDAGRAVWAPILDQPARFRVHTVALAERGELSFLPARNVLDHIVSTAALGDELLAGDVEIPRLDALITSYQSAVSDHLPVVASMAWCKP